MRRMLPSGALGRAAALLAAALCGPAWAADAAKPAISGGDTAWLLISTVLVTRGSGQRAVVSVNASQHRATPPGGVRWPRWRRCSPRRCR